VAARRFAPDEQFPDTILAALGLGIPEAELVPIRPINSRLCSLEERRRNWPARSAFDR
jgi:hypothetical protein